MPKGVGKLVVACGLTAILVAAVALVFAFIHLGGWLVVGLIGLGVLGASFWLDLLDGDAVVDYAPGGEAVTLLVMQRAQRAQLSLEQKLAAAAERKANRFRHSVARGVGFILVLAGFGFILLS